jgi:hypothetical protein
MKSHLSSIVGRVAAVAVATLVLASPDAASAKDSLSVEVANATGSPVIKNNGEAVGTIQLFYVVNATQYPTGLFATFDINWLITAALRNPTNYGAGIPFVLTQDQQGGHVRLMVEPSSFVLTHAGQTGTSRVSIHIEPDKDGNLPPSLDGTDLVANLKLDAGSKVGTVTNVQVHILLAHPTSCIKVYNFVTDQDMNLGILSTTNVNSQQNGPQAGTIRSSQPGQFSDNVLVANLCPTAETFDLRVALDAAFSTNPAGNPGNAVHAYSASGEFDTTNFGELLSATSTAYGQNLCLQNMTVAPEASLLVTVHSKLKDGHISSLPADGDFNFWAMLYDTPNGSCSGDPEPLASPTPATFVLPFTINVK